MRPPISIRLILGLVVGLHADWHLARPHAERLSLNWHQHWIFCVVFFGAAAWLVHQRWPERQVKASFYNVGLALFGAQVIEPLLESAYYLHRVSYDVEPGRWAAFAQCVGAGLLAFTATLWMLTRHQGTPGAA